MANVISQLLVFVSDEIYAASAATDYRFPLFCCLALAALL